jgi:hypothetical protein
MSVAGTIALDVRADARDRATKVLQQTSKQLSKVQKELAASGAVSTKMGQSVAAATANMGRFGQRLTTVADGAGKLAAKLGGLRGGLVVAAAAMAVAGMKRLGEEGAVLEAQLSRLGGTAGEARERIEALAKDAGGVFSVKDLAKFEAKQKELGISIAFSGEELEKLDARFTALGRNGGQALDQVAEALASGRTGTLKRLGLVRDLEIAWKEAADAQGKAISELTDAEKSAITLANMRDQIRGISTESGSSVAAFERLSASMSDAMTAIQMALAPVGKALAPLGDMLKSLAEIIELVLGPVVSLLSDAFGALFEAVGFVLGLLRDGVKMLTGGLARAFGLAEKSAQDFTKEIQAQAKAAQATDRALDALAKTTDTLSGLQDAAADALRLNVEGEIKRAEAVLASGKALTEEEKAQLAVNRAFLDSSKISDTYAKKQRAIAKTLTEAEKDLKFNEAGLRAIQQAHLDGTISIDTYVKASGSIGSANAALSGKIAQLRGEYDKLAVSAGTALDNIGGDKPKGRRSGGATAAQRIEFARKELEILQATGEVQKARLQNELDIAQLKAGFRGSGKSKDEQAALLAVERARGMQSYLDAVRAAAEAEAALVRVQKESGTNETTRREEQARRVVLIERQLELLKVESDRERELLRAEHQRQDALSDLAAAREDGSLGLEREADARLRLLDLQRKKLLLAHQELEAEREQQEALRQTVEAFRDAGGAVGAYDQRLGGLITSLGDVTQIWGDFAAAQEQSSAAMIGAAKDSVGTMGHSLAAFVEDTRARAAIQGAIEAARAMMALAAAIETGDASMYAAFATHTIASGMFFAVAGGAGGRSSGSGGGSAQGGSTGGGNFGPSSGGGGSSSSGGQTTVVVQFNDGVVLGRPQDVGRAVQEAQDAMRGTGSKAAA